MWFEPHWNQSCRTDVPSLSTRWLATSSSTCCQSSFREYVLTQKTCFPWSDGSAKTTCHIGGQRRCRHGQSVSLRCLNRLKHRQYKSEVLNEGPSTQSLFFMTIEAVVLPHAMSFSLEARSSVSSVCIPFSQRDQMILIGAFPGSGKSTRAKASSMVGFEHLKRICISNAMASMNTTRLESKTRMPGVSR